MKVTESYYKPTNRDLHTCHLCKGSIDFTKLIQYKYPGADALVFAQVGFMDGEGYPVKLCAGCRLLAYKRLGQNMAEASYKVVDYIKPERKPRRQPQRAEKPLTSP
jgi:hypothetical protein